MTTAEKRETDPEILREDRNRYRRKLKAAKAEIKAMAKRVAHREDQMHSLVAELTMTRVALRNMLQLARTYHLEVQGAYEGTCRAREAALARGNREMAEYNLGRREALRWAADRLPQLIPQAAPDSPAPGTPEETAPALCPEPISESAQ